MESWIHNGKNQSLFLGMSFSPLLSQNEKLGYIVSFQDLTEIRKREEEVQLKEKMAAIGQISADLAHEIRNPLGSLSGSIQILKSELKLSQEKRRLIEIVLRECHRLNNIIAHFLDYAGPQTSRLQPVDLFPLVQDTAELFKNDPEFQKSHSLQISSPGGPIRCLADPDQFQQVVWNILQNGVRAMPQGGKLTVELRNRDSSTLVRFRDEGIGMSPEEYGKLFQPFHQGFRKGSGLGMAIVYQIIQQHHGRIEVRSRPGKGTEVDIWLPRDPLGSSSDV